MADEVVEALEAIADQLAEQSKRIDELSKKIDSIQSLPSATAKSGSSGMDKDAASMLQSLVVQTASLSAKVDNLSKKGTSNPALDSSLDEQKKQMEAILSALTTILEQVTAIQKKLASR